MRTGTKLAIAGVAAFAVAVVAVVWSLASDVIEESADEDPAALIEQTTLEGFRRVTMVNQTRSGDRVSYAVYIGPRTEAGPEMRISGRDDQFTGGAMAPEEWDGAMEGLSKSRLNDQCWANLLRFLPDRLPDDQLTSWGVSQNDVAEARAGKLDVAYAQIMCAAPQH